MLGCSTINDEIEHLISVMIITFSMFKHVFFPLILSNWGR